MIAFVLKTVTAAVLGWIPAALMLVLLSGCVKMERDPLAVYHVDPKAFQFFVVPF